MAMKKKFLPLLMAGMVVVGTTGLVNADTKTLTGNDCTCCGYCMPCPEDVDIINCFKEYNIGKMLNNPKGSALQYFTLIDDDCRADSCINCGECEFVCPQMLDIPQELEKVDEYFGREFNHF